MPGLFKERKPLSSLKDFRIITSHLNFSVHTKTAHCFGEARSINSFKTVVLKGKPLSISGACYSETTEKSYFLLAYHNDKEDLEDGPRKVRESDELAQANHAFCCFIHSDLTWVPLNKESNGLLVETTDLQVKQELAKHFGLLGKPMSEAQAEPLEDSYVTATFVAS